VAGGEALDVELGQRRIRRMKLKKNRADPARREYCF
jgi:hypothetical protein